MGRWPTRYKPDRLNEALEQSQAKYSHVADFFKFFDVSRIRRGVYQDRPVENF